MCRAWLEHDRPCPRTYGTPGAATLDGDLVAFGHNGSPDFPLLCERMLMRRPGIAVTYKIFDLVHRPPRLAPSAVLCAASAPSCLLVRPDQPRRGSPP